MSRYRCYLHRGDQIAETGAARKTLGTPSGDGK